MAYSMDYRKRVVEYHKEGNSLRATAKVFKVAVNTIRQWERMLEEENTLAKRPSNRHFRKLDPEKLRQHVNDYSDAYLRERAEYFGVSVSGIHKALKKLKITYKKNEYIQRARSAEGSRI